MWATAGCGPAKDKVNDKNKCRAKDPALTKGRLGRGTLKLVCTAEYPVEAAS
jgi:hypothetical protein